MKKMFSLFISIVLVASGCISAFATQEVESEFSVKIVHTNDIHSRVVEDESSEIIGISKLKTLIDDYTEDSDMSLVLDSGDTFHGQSIATLVKGESIARLIGACEYDAMTAGNHDWNYGKERLKELVNIVDDNNSKDFSMLTGNVINNDGTKFFDDEYLIKTIEKNGEELKVGVFGVIDPDIYSDTAPSNVSGLVFTDMEQYSEEAVKHLESEGCQLIIALAHSYSPTELASKVDGVDLWLAGHEHIDINEIVNTPNGEKTLVIENGYYLYKAGLIELNFDLTDNEVENLEYTTSSADYTVCSDLDPNAEVQALLDEINAEQNIINEEVAGTSPVELDGVWEHLRIAETTMGRAVTSAYLLETGADVAFENAGGIRASISAGDVTYGDIINVMPYGNYIVTKQVSGSDLLEILETSIEIQIKCIEANNSGIYDAWPSNSGSYLQVGGMNVEYDLSESYGNRIKSAYVGNEKIDSEKIYTVATNNYLATSSDYPKLASKEKKGDYSACDEALITYFEQDEDYILNSVNAVRMVEVTTPSLTEPTTVSTEPTTGIVPEPSGTDATSSTSKPIATKLNSATPDNTNGISTGNNFTVYSIVAVIIASIALIYMLRRKFTVNK
ncbi:MAG: bifunctional UDP-sugar hydrolase/5'-nucleotidase [Ruminococcus sp.]|nr:bifunctional UDP-sugar hydrolase/5'-nucleotidase [Ruminococcus sp.]